MDKKLYSVMKVSILVFCVLLAIMAIFLLFPRKYTYSDGGTVVYESFGFGAIYAIEQRHCYTSVLDENGYAYYEKGTVWYNMRGIYHGGRLWLQPRNILTSS